MKRLERKHRKRFGPLIPFTELFRKNLIDKGYKVDSAKNLVGVFHHLSRWMDINDKKLVNLNLKETEKFLKHRKRLGYICWLSQKGLVQIIQFFKKLQMLKQFEDLKPKTQLDKLMDQYRKYLVEERGLVKTTQWQYCAVAQNFIKTSIGPKLDFNKLNAKVVRSYILRESSSSYKTKAISAVSALRSLLRWLHIQGKVDSSLKLAVPAVARYRSSIPKSINNETIEFLIKSCDNQDSIDYRTHAVLLLMARMGLRRGEIAGLTLDCIEWNRGEIIVKSKGSEGRLPLSEEIGEALAKYIQKSRPHIKDNNIFLRSRAPYRRLSSNGIFHILSSHCKRVGVQPIHPHQLRHAAATQMLEKGSSLSEIGQVLRHTSLYTTTIYAKIDHLALREVVRAWPGGVS